MPVCNGTRQERVREADEDGSELRGWAGSERLGRESTPQEAKRLLEVGPEVTAPQARGGDVVLLRPRLVETSSC